MKKIVLIIVALLLVGFILTNNPEGVECAKLSETECLKHQNICSLCPEEIISSYASCHTIEFCKNIPFEIDNEYTKQRDAVIEEYLLSQDHFSWQTEVGSKRICVFEELGNEDGLFPLYLWVFCGEYKDGEELSGSSGPVLIDYPNEMSFFTVEKMTHKVPRDGSFYSKDIKEIFPQDVQDEILNIHNGGIIKNLQIKIQEKL